MKLFTIFKYHYSHLFVHKIAGFVKICVTLIELCQLLAMNALISSFSILLRNSKRSLLYGTIAALTIGLQELFESVVFDCPCERHFVYGMAFLWAPSFLLFLPGILLEKKLWRKFPRRIYKTENAEKPITRQFRTLLLTLEMFVRASVAPIAWLVMSFLQQKYYTCAYFGPPLDRDIARNNATDGCYSKLGARSIELEDSYKTNSQMAGWSLMIITMLTLFASVCIRRCNEKGKHLRMPSRQYYLYVEAKEALEQFHTKAKELAKQNATRNVQIFFQNANKKGFDESIQEVAESLLSKYEKFFPIPPESPTYTTPVVMVDNPLKYPELFSEIDGPQIPKDEYHRHTTIEIDKDTKQLQLTPLNRDRVKLNRQHGQNGDPV